MTVEELLGQLKSLCSKWHAEFDEASIGDFSKNACLDCSADIHGLIAEFNREPKPTEDDFDLDREWHNRPL